MSQSSRRGFLQTACAVVPSILRADDKAGSKLPIVGTGTHTYEVHHDWGEVPDRIAWGNTHGVVEDSQGRIYVCHTVHATSASSDAVVVFDDKGKFVKSWGPRFKGGAHGLHIQKEGDTEFLFVSDFLHGIVVKTTLDGDELFTIGYPEESEAYKPGPDGAKPKYSPTNVATAPNGDIYIADGYGSSYVNQYDAKRKYIRTFGGKGKEAGQLDCPHGIIVDTRGDKPLVTVADRANNRLQRFTLDGRHVDFIGGTNLPCHFGYFKNGDVVIPDLGAKVTLMDRQNKVITDLGDDSATKYRETRLLTRDHFPPGKFVCPHGACFDHNGNIFVVEWVEVGRVTKLTKV